MGRMVRRGIDFRRFRTPSFPIFGIILGLLETTKQTSKYDIVYRFIYYLFYWVKIVQDYTQKISTSKN